MSYRQLKNFYPLVFGGKTTNSNNKGWLYRVIKARYEEGDDGGRVKGGRDGRGYQAEARKEGEHGARRLRRSGLSDGH